MSLPYLTSSLPGIAGALRTTDDDFAVDEELPYAPSGAGDHVFVRIEKRGTTTLDAVRALARALGVRDRDVGVAGMKDRHAVTRQWLSLPPPVTPEQALAVELPAVRVLEAQRHPHKLRTGHVRANRFALRVRGVDGDAAARARAILDALARPPGAPNWYGEQRFGAAGDNAARGRALLTEAHRSIAGQGPRDSLGGGNPRGMTEAHRSIAGQGPRDSLGGGNPRGVTGERAPGAGRRNDRRLDRLMVSALQSQLFNDWLTARLLDGLYDRVLAGDVLHKRGGGMFVCEDPSTDQARLAAGELVVTGPMFGERMRMPAPASPAAAREAEVLERAGLPREAFAAVRAIAEGTRRDAAIDVTGATVAAVDGSTLEVGFALPGGAYATVVMREVMKLPERVPNQPRNDGPAPEDAPEDPPEGAPENPEMAE